MLEAARIGARTSPASWAASRRASSTPPTSPRTRCTARSPRRCAAGDDSLARRARRTACWSAMSGGVDSAVAALLCAQAGREVVAVTLKLWADQEGDGERSCCSPQAVLGARALAHSMGLPHLTLDLEDRFRAAVVDHFVAEHDAGRTPNPCVRCNGLVRFDAMLALAERARRRRARHRSLRADRARRRGAAAGARRRPQQGPDLHALGAARRTRSPRVRFPLGDLTKPQVREIARGARAAGGREAREPGPLLPRRHDARALPRAPRRRPRASRARSWTRAAACSAATAATAATRSGSAGASAWPPGAAVRALHRRGRQPGRRRPARGSSPRATVTAAGRRPVPRRAARRPREAALPLRAACRVAVAAALAQRGRARLSRPHAAHGVAAGRPRRWSAPSAHGRPTRAPRTAPRRSDHWATATGRARYLAREDWPSHRGACAPGQTACLMDGDRVVGHGTIASPPP